MNILRLLGFNTDIVLKHISEYNAERERIFSEFVCHTDEQKFGEFWDEKYEEIRKTRMNIFCKGRKFANEFKANYQRERASIHNIVVEYNESFVKQEKERCKDLFSNIDGKCLDEQQQTVIVTNEDNNLVIAGAGSGKTLTISAKVKYLYSRKHIKSEEILLLSFTKKAADEMTERIQGKLRIPVEASTFHKLGLSIISSAQHERPDVNDNVAKIIKEYFKREIIKDYNNIKNLIMFFGFYLEIPAEASKFDSLGECYEYEKGREFETIRHQMNKDVFVSSIVGKQGREKITIKGEKVKSREETMIANYLFLNGVNYIYEPIYPFLDNTDRMRKTYHPDFYLPDYDIYLEHFGIDRENKTPWLSPIEEEKYLDGIEWKRKLHSLNKTQLVETYSYYISEGTIFNEIDNLLKPRGVKYREPDYYEIFNSVYADMEDKYFAEFLKLCGTFIVLFKSNGLKIEDLRKLSFKSQSLDTPFHIARKNLFFDIIEPLLNYYTECLDNSKQVDFSDMINKATDIVKEGSVILNYKYIIVDEFQDMSLARFKLIKAILEQTGAKLLCVGDDWQSIYRFAGSDIDLFTKFEDYFGYTATMYIEKTYRNSQQLIDLTGKFVMMNPAQKTKNLKSDKRLEKPLQFIETLGISSEDDSENNNSDNSCEVLDLIISKYGVNSSIMFLGRTNMDLDRLRNSKVFDINNKSDGTVGIIYKKSPQTPISFLTVHKSKGMEADNTILLNFTNGLLGFPNKISDDPLLELVLSGSDTYMYAEERRLLYVALTRTRNYSYVLVDKQSPSEFYNDFENEIIKKQSVSCPRCKTGHLIRRNNGNSTFAGCSNYPQCDYTVFDIGIIEKPILCPKCGGFIVTRHGKNGDFQSCSNYPYCKSEDINQRNSKALNRYGAYYRTSNKNKSNNLNLQRKRSNNYYIKEMIKLEEINRKISYLKTEQDEMDTRGEPINEWDNPFMDG